MNSTKLGIQANHKSVVSVQGADASRKEDEILCIKTHDMGL